MRSNAGMANRHKDVDLHFAQSLRPQHFGLVWSRLFFLLSPSMKMEVAECSETSAYKIKVLGNHPKEGIHHSEHGESLKSRINYVIYRKFVGGLSS